MTRSAGEQTTHHTITAITPAVKTIGRFNIFVDGAFAFSLDGAQVLSSGIVRGQTCTSAQLTVLKDESVYGKLYARALEYTMLRPHSEKEVRDYLWRKTQSTRDKHGQKKPGVSQAIADRVFAALKDKGHVNDETFARYWAANRSVKKGISRRKLAAELAAKGISRQTIEAALTLSQRDEQSELAKIIAKKRSRYTDEQKLTAYLVRQGFHYDDIKAVLGTSYD